jgi:hypothetical protein
MTTIPAALEQQAVARVLAEAERIERDARRQLAWARWHGELCYAQGDEDGYRRGREEADAEWMEVLRPGREAAGRRARSQSHGELEGRRYPEGRPERSCPTCGQPHRDGLRDAV